MGSSPSFGSAPRNSTPSSDSLALRLPGFPRLTSLLRTTRRPVLQKVRRQGLLPLRLLVGQRFQVLFHSPPGVLFTFPSRYWCTIGRLGYLALGGGPPGFPRDSPCPVVLGSSLSGPFEPSLTRLSRSLADLSVPFSSARRPPRASPAARQDCPTTPHGQRRWALTPVRFRLFPVRSPLLRESRLLSFPRGTEMFHFPRFPARPKPCCQGSSPWRVSPFGHPRINACLRLPGAYRCWPRPSSARRRLGIHRWPYLAWPQRCFLPCAVVKVLLVRAPGRSPVLTGGGLRWIRTTDLTLIRRAL